MITLGFVGVGLVMFALGWATAFAVYSGRARMAEIDKRTAEDKLIAAMTTPRATVEPPKDYYTRGGRA